MAEKIEVTSPTQETRTEDCSSQSVIASSLVCHTKESVIASRATLNEILKKAENLDEQMKKELCKLNDNLAAVEKNVEQLHGICENNKERVNELKVEKDKTEDKILSLDKSMETVKEKVNEMDGKHSDHETRLKEVENYIDEKKSQEQMQERKKKRMSGDFSLEEFRQHVPIQTIDRGRIDSGISMAGGKTDDSLPQHTEDGNDSGNASLRSSRETSSSQIQENSSSLDDSKSETRFETKF